MPLDDYTVPRGTYTDYINSGHRALVDSLNSLQDDVVVIGSDIKIVIKSEAKDGTSAQIPIDRDANPSFLNDFASPFQHFDFKSSDAGKPGAMSVSNGISYDTGRFSFYLTKTFYEKGENHVFYDSFCRTIGQLYKQQYMNVNKYGYAEMYREPSESHYGSLLSISAPIVTIEVQFGDVTMIRYCNVKFSSPALKSGNFIVNDAILLQFNFAFSYISLDNIDRSRSFGSSEL